MPFVSQGETLLWYEDRGHGHAGMVLLIHGGLFDPMNVERFWIVPGIVGGLVAHGVRVIAPDRRFGIGRTVAPFAVHSWLTEADDMLTTLGAAGVARAHVVAGSNGCSVAMRLALDYPEMVASLTLCWPATPVTALEEAFERAITTVKAQGAAAYLAGLRRSGVPRLGEHRPGFPFGFALLHDDRLAEIFSTHSGIEVATILSATAAELLPGDPIRGVRLSELARLSRLSMPVAVIPTEPEDPYHRHTTVQATINAIPGSRLMPGFPVAPTPAFWSHRSAFISTILRVLINNRELQSL